MLVTDLVTDLARKHIEKIASTIASVLVYAIIFASRNFIFFLYTCSCEFSKDGGSFSCQSTRLTRCTNLIHCGNSFLARI